jgi:hypothetical protein
MQELFFFRCEKLENKWECECENGKKAIKKWIQARGGKIKLIIGIKVAGFVLKNEDLEINPHWYTAKYFFYYFFHLPENGE